MSRRKRNSDHRRGARTTVQGSPAALRTIRRASQFLAAASALVALIMALMSYWALREYIAPKEDYGLFANLIERVSVEQAIRLACVSFTIFHGAGAYLLWRHSSIVGRLLADPGVTTETVIAFYGNLFRRFSAAAGLALFVGLMIVVVVLLR